MGKKKGRRQSDPAREDCETTDEDEPQEQEKHCSCPHTGKAVALGAIKKNLKIAWVRVGQCAVCLREKKMANRPSNPPPRDRQGGKRTLQDQKREQLERARLEQKRAAEKMKPAETIVPENEKKEGEESAAEVKAKNATVMPQTVWLCLRCGSQACGSTSEGHCIQHYKTPRSELHCLFVKTATWEIFCFECNKEIYVDSHKKLYEAVEFIKKTNTKPNKSTAPKAIPSLTLPKITAKEAKDQANITLQSSLLPKVKGLNNLGNTCFFNSVIQCLSQTHPLTQYIDMHANKGTSLSLQVIDDETEDENDNILSSFVMPEINVQLAEGGPMLTSLAAFLKDIHSVGKTQTISPSHLFGQVVKQSPKFRGMQQQDSQELLRYLMDGLRNEEVKRQMAAILRFFGLSEKTDPSGVPKGVKKKLKLYGRAGQHTLVDKIFSGQMVSTIVCEECHFSSQTYEPFLDLSLPVVEDKPHKPRGLARQVNPPGSLPDDEDDVRVTCCGVQEEKRSKGHTKKEKARKKKEKKQNMQNEAKNIKDDITKSQELQNNNCIESQTPENVNKNKAELAQSSVIIQHSDPKPEHPQPESQRPSTQAAKPTESSVRSSTGKPAVAARAGEKPSTVWKDGKADDDEEEEEEGYEEGEEDGWEWDYGETWEEGDKEEGTSINGEKKQPTDSCSEEAVSVEAECAATAVEESPRPPLRSLNPLPPEMIRPVEEHEKSAERTTTEGNTEEETGASSNADVEDNDTDGSRKNWAKSNHVLASLSSLAPVNLDPLNLDPHMEILCKGIKLLKTEEVAGSDQSSTKYHTAESDACQAESWTEDQAARLRNEWTTRTLVSLAPRYESKAGECSVYSCLNQFTQSELLTGSNKWACDSCTSKRNNSDSRTADNNCSDKPSAKKTVYSNASKQFLIFVPPMVLTLHLKRFQQTLAGCRKMNKHVSFPLSLDLAPFCSSTCLAVESVKFSQSKVLYSLYGVVEHSGRLQGGHYTAYVKVRASEFHTSDYFAPPLSKPTDIPRFLRQLQAKTNLDEGDTTNNGSNNSSSGGDAEGQPRRWFHISDTSVTEVSEEKVLKAQAYLLFYQRTL